MIKELSKTTKEGDKLYGVELKPIYENMLVHPWYDAEDKGENKKSGYHEVLNKAKETVSKEI